jgi:hypothetical protein
VSITEIKEWLQAVAFLSTAIGVVVALVKFKTELAQTREQRARDLRWKQAESAKTLNDEMLDDPEVMPILEMLDNDGGEFELPRSKRRERVTHDDIRKALRTKDAAGKHAEIRACFDSLCYYLALLQHHMSTTKLVLPEDVAYPLEYYLRHLARFRPEVEAYLDAHGLDQPRALLHRYAAWTEAPASR